MSQAAQPRPERAEEPQREEPRRALTAVRGIAAWWVVAFHFREALPLGTPAWMLRLAASGYLAVDLFFLLSGYVIALNYATWFTGSARSLKRYGHFLALRLSRVYPVHLFMLLVFPVLPAATLLFAHSHTTGDLQASYYLLSIPLLQGWGMFAGPAWNVPAWSISTEWLAYLVFPAIAIAAARLCATIASAACILFALLAVLALVASQASANGLGNVSWSFPPIRCVIEFSAGVALFHLGANRARDARETAAALAAAALCCLIYATSTAPDYLLMPAAFAALVHGLTDERAQLAAWLRAWPLQWLGVVSYSTYMCHYFAKISVKILLVRPGMPAWVPFTMYLAAVLAGSALLHRLIERPSQRALRSYLWRPA